MIRGEVDLCFGKESSLPSSTVTRSRLILATHVAHAPRGAVSCIAAGADVDGARVGAVEVGSDRRLVGEL